MSTSSSSLPQAARGPAAAPSGDDGPAQSPAPIPRPPNAWILYRSHKIEQLRREELRLAAQEQATSSPSDPMTPAKGHVRRSSSGAGGLKRGALTASALAALGGTSQDGDPSPTKPFFGAFEDRRSRVGSPTPSLSSTFAPSSSFVQPPSNATSFREPSSASGMTASTAVPISTLLAQMWRSEPESVKSTFKDMAKRKEAEHKQAYPEYKYTPRVTEKSIKARQKAKGLRKIATGKLQTDVSAEQAQSSRSLRSASPKKQRYPPPQTSPRRGLRSARGQGSPNRDDDFRRSLSPMRESARPYPTLNTLGESRPENTQVALQAPDGRSAMGLRRSPRFKQAGTASLMSSNAVCRAEAPESTDAEESQDFDSAKVDELMNCIAKAVESQPSDSPLSPLRHGANASTPFSTSASPWSPAEHGKWPGDDCRRDFDYDMHSYLADQSLEGSYAAGSVLEDMDSSTFDIASPSHAAMGFFAPLDEAANEGDQSIVDIPHSNQSHFDTLSRSCALTVEEQQSSWKEPDCAQDLSFEYLLDQPSGMKFDDFIMLQDVSRRKRRHPKDGSTSIDEDESSKASTQRCGRQSLQYDKMSYSCSSLLTHRQSSTRTLTNVNDSHSNDTTGCADGHSSAFVKSKGLTSEVPDFSLPLELVDFSFDHRERAVAEVTHSHEAACKEATFVEGQDESMNTWADTTGPPERDLTACAFDQLHCGISERSPTYANGSPVWTRQHTKIAKFLLRQAGQEDTIPSVSSSNYTSPRADVCAAEIVFEPIHESLGLGATIDPSLTLTHGTTKARASTDLPQRREGEFSSQSHQSGSPIVAKYNFINSALPRSAQPLYHHSHRHGTSDTTASSPSSPLTSRTSHNDITTSVTMSPLAVGPTSPVSERAKQWEAMTRQGRPPPWPPIPQRLAATNEQEGESPALVSSAMTVSPANERLELNGSYTEEELLDLLARRRMQRAEGRERER